MSTTGHLRRGLAAAVIALVTGCSAASVDGPAEPAPIEVDVALRALLPDDVARAGALAVVTDAAYPPASSFAADGRTIEGFEPDLLAAIGDLLGLEIDLRHGTFASLLDDLQAGESDLVVSAMTDTAEREKQADFVTYFRAGTTILVQSGNPHAIHALSDLCGQSVAVEAGVVQVDLVERSQPRCGEAPIDLRTFPSNHDALVELRTGRVAAVLNDYPPAVFLTTDEHTAGAFSMVSDVQYEPGLYGLAVAKDRPQLRDALAAALARLVETGVYQHILDSWGVTGGAVSEVTINGRRLGGT